MTRRSGRTIRMVEEANRLANEGRVVYVVTANSRERDRIRPLVVDSVKVETPSSCGNFDWQSMSLRGAHPNCQVLVDHFAIESQFGRMLEMLHRFD